LHGLLFVKNLPSPYKEVLRHHPMLEEYYAQLCEELQLPVPFFDPKTPVIKLALDVKLILELRKLETGMYLHTRLPEIPENDKELFLEHIMSANLLGQGTGEGVLGLEQDEKFLTLSAAFPYEMDYRTFKEKLEDFANIAAYWNTEILSWRGKHQGL